MSKRIYVIEKNEPGINQKSEYLVRASSASAGLRAVAAPMFTAKVASQDDLVRLAKTHHVKEA